MNRQNIQTGRSTVFAAILFIIIALLVIYGLIQASSALIRWISSQAGNADPSVVAALMAGSGTILGSVFIASFNARRAQERAAEEANRGKKIEAYNTFVVSLMEMLNNQKGKEGEVSVEDLGFMNEFVPQLMVHGGPAVIKAFGEWRTIGDSISNKDNKEILACVENLLLAMRSDLGISNQGLKKYELLGLFIIGGKPELVGLSLGGQDPVSLRHDYKTEVCRIPSQHADQLHLYQSG